MEKDIDNALSQPISKGTTEPPPKKRRKVDQNPQPRYIEEEIEEEEESKGFFARFYQADAKTNRKELKKVLIRNPDLDVGEHDEIDQFIASKTDKEVKDLLEEMKFQEGMKKPNLNGISFLGISGDALDWVFGGKGLSKRLIEDKELVEMVETVVPSDFSWMSTPFRIANRIIYHMQFKE